MIFLLKYGLVFFFFNGLRRAVRKVGDCFGTVSSGEPFERMTIVFLNGQLAEPFEEMTIFSVQLISSRSSGC